MESIEIHDPYFIEGHRTRLVRITGIQKNTHVATRLLLFLHVFSFTSVCNCLPHFTNLIESREIAKLNTSSSGDFLVARGKVRKLSQTLHTTTSTSTSTWTFTSPSHCLQLHCPNYCSHRCLRKVTTSPVGPICLPRAFAQPIHKHGRASAATQASRQHPTSFIRLALILCPTTDCTAAVALGQSAKSAIWIAADLAAAVILQHGSSAAYRWHTHRRQRPHEASQLAAVEWHTRPAAVSVEPHGKPAECVGQSPLLLTNSHHPVSTRQ